MDDLDLALRSRLRLLADAVPVAERPLERVRRPSSAMRWTRFAPLAAGVVVVVTAAITLSILGRAPGPATTPSTPAVPVTTSSPSPSAPGSPGSPSPEPASDAPATTAVGQLRVELLVESECPQTEGGRCTYDATVAGPDGTNRRFPITSAWTDIGPGTYRLDFTSRYGSDIIRNGSPFPGATAASCTAGLSEPDAGPRILARIVVRSESCVIEIIDGKAVVSPDASPPPTDVTVPLPYPEGCAPYGLSPRRCAYIVDKAIAAAGMTGRVAMVELLGDPDCIGTVPNCSQVRLGGGIFIVRVRVTPEAGQPSDHPVYCGIGGETSLLCTDTPRIRVTSPVQDGYSDVPCNGEGGLGTCASPVPTIDPVTAKDAVPLEVTSVIVPIEHEGEYAIDIGEAVLPNGILSEGTVTLANDRRSDVLIPDGVRLEVIGEDGKPLANAYEHGWRPGTERVHVRVTFTVEAFEPGASLILTSIVVR